MDLAYPLKHYKLEATPRGWRHKSIGISQLASNESIGIRKFPIKRIRRAVPHILEVLRERAGRGGAGIGSPIKKA